MEEEITFEPVVTDVEPENKDNSFVTVIITIASMIGIGGAAVAIRSFRAKKKASKELPPPTV
jgi:hypothetical protein